MQTHNASSNETVGVRCTFTFTNEYIAGEDMNTGDAGSIQAKRAARRAAMPVVTAILAEYADFAPTVVWAQENGITVGKAPVYAEVFDIPTGYRPMAQIEAKGRK